MTPRTSYGSERFQKGQQAVVGTEPAERRVHQSAIAQLASAQPRNVELRTLVRVATALGAQGTCRFARVGDLDLLGLGEATEAAINAAVREIVATSVDDDGLVFDVGALEVHPIREDHRYGGLRAVMQARLAKVEAMVDLGISNSRMKDFCDVALAARRVAFVGEALVVALRATFRRRGTPFPDGEIVEPFAHARSAVAFVAQWNPGGPWA